MFLSLSFLSCSKSGNNSSAPPSNTPTDTLAGWKVVGNITALAGIYDIWFTSPSQGFATVSDGYLYDSQDSGKTWTKTVNTNIDGDMAVNLFFVGEKHGFAEGFNHMFVTKDGGITWAPHDLPIANHQNIGIQSEFFISPSEGYISDLAIGVYKTTDTGETWTRTFQSSRQSASYAVYFLDPARGFLFCGDGSFSKTVDSGASWQQIQQNVFVAPNGGYSYNTLQFLDSLTGFYASEMGMYRQRQGTPAGSPLINITFYPPFLSIAQTRQSPPPVTGSQKGSSFLPQQY